MANEKADRQFKSTSKATSRMINGRFREGHTLEDFKKVIDSKVADWRQDAFWSKYLRPSTLFSATKFENYLEAAKRQKIGKIMR